MDQPNQYSVEHKNRVEREKLEHEADMERLDHIRSKHSYIETAEEVARRQLEARRKWLIQQIAHEVASLHSHKLIESISNSSLPTELYRHGVRKRVTEMLNELLIDHGEENMQEVKKVWRIIFNRIKHSLGKPKE